MRIYLSEKVIISLLRVDKSSCLRKSMSFTVVNYRRKFPTFTFVVEAMFSLMTYTQVLVTVIKPL